MRLVLWEIGGRSEGDGRDEWCGRSQWCGEGDYKGEWCTSDRPTAPGRPEAVDREGSVLSRLAYVKVENDALLLRWDSPNTDGGSPITGYVLERSEGLGEMWVRVNLVPIKDTEYAVANLIGGRDYRFRVSAENAVGVSPPSQTSEPVSISTDQEATEPHFLKELRNAVAVETQRVEFSVDIIGTPPPDITWYKDGFEVYDTRRFGFLMEGDRYTLVLKEAKLQDEGDIRVRATNRVGVASSQASLIVQAPPTITLPAQYEQGLIFDTDELIRLRVPYTGRPQPQATWTYNGKPVESDERHSMDVSEKYATLKIAGANRLDKGMYTLKLTNPQGNDHASFFVTVTDRPDPPSQPVITDVSGTSITLRWNPPQDDGGCRVSNYTIEYFRVGWDVWLKAASSRITWTQLADLIVGSQYRFRIKAENAYGVSEPGQESQQVLIEEAKSPSESFEYETYKSTTTVGSSLPKDSATLVKGDSSSFEYGGSSENSATGSFEVGEGLVERAQLLGRGPSNEGEFPRSGFDSQEPSLDLGTSTEKPPSFEYGDSRGPSLEVGSSEERDASFEQGMSVERGFSYEMGSSGERGQSFELGSSMERGQSYELGSSGEERGPSFEMGSSEEKGSSFDMGISAKRFPSFEMGSSAERDQSYELGSSLDRDSSLELGSSTERSPSFEQESTIRKGSSTHTKSSGERGPTVKTEKPAFQFGSSGEMGDSLEKEVSIEVTDVDGIPKNFLPVGASYDLSASLDRGSPCMEEQRAEGDSYPTGPLQESHMVTGSAGESMDFGGSVESSEPPTPPPRLPRKGGRSPALPPLELSGTRTISFHPVHDSSHLHDNIRQSLLPEDDDPECIVINTSPNPQALVHTVTNTPTTPYHPPHIANNPPCTSILPFHVPALHTTQILLLTLNYTHPTTRHPPNTPLLHP
ncbi:hypothetical protein Pmani_021429 [Petrolisthes manimaculis]|uniref:Uncharacterized protein n=1 Tax=Petrolisthes manimaculis TaxID=1843537 RepID=A0AAE1PET7_9EUCA|nr:hypothetical protein Pmani_021429 [Petrolisthes manimaculis]